MPFDPYDFFGYLASGFVIVIGMNVVLGFPHVLGVELMPVEALLLLLAVYVTGQCMSSPAKALLEDVIVGRVLRTPAVILVASRRPPAWCRILPSYYRALPAGIRERLLTRCASEGLGSDEIGEAVFLHVRFAPDVRTDTTLMKRLEEFRNKYAFCRNLSFVCVFVGLAMLGRWYFDPRQELSRYGAAALVAGVLLFYRYLKFFRQYTFELFNTYANARFAETVQ